jgi:uncharacterized membrane protein
MIIPWPQADSWGGALRFALAAMFAFTAISHFHPRIRPDLIRMVPSSLPAAPLLVTATGILELLGATGLLIVRPPASFAARLAESITPSLRPPVTSDHPS